MEAKGGWLASLAGWLAEVARTRQREAGRGVRSQLRRTLLLGGVAAMPGKHLLRFSAVSCPCAGAFVPEMRVAHSLAAFKVLLTSQVLKEASPGRIFFVHTTIHFLRRYFNFLLVYIVCLFFNFL